MAEIKIFRPQIQSHQVAKPEQNPKFNQTNQLNRVNNPYRYVPSEVMDFAKSMETQFSELMLKEMQKTSNENNSDSANEFYNGLLTSERAKALTETSSKGIKDLILDDVYPEYKRTAQNFAAYENQKAVFNKQKIKMYEGPSNSIEMHNNGTSE